jgi:hypothetical protein
VLGTVRVVVGAICTTTEWYLRFRTVALGASEIAFELSKHKDVLFTAVRRHTFAS